MLGESKWSKCIENNKKKSKMKKKKLSEKRTLEVEKGKQITFQHI